MARYAVLSGDSTELPPSRRRDWATGLAYLLTYTSGLLCIVIHFSRGDQMGQHPVRNWAGKGGLGPGITFPVTSEAGLSLSPFTRSLLHDDGPPQKPHEPGDFFERFPKVNGTGLLEGCVTQAESPGKPHVLRMQL